MNWAGIQQLRRTDKNGHFTFQDKTNMSKYFCIATSQDFHFTYYRYAVIFVGSVLIDSRNYEST